MKGTTGWKARPDGRHATLTTSSDLIVGGWSPGLRPRRLLLTVLNLFVARSYAGDVDERHEKAIKTNLRSSFSIRHASFGNEYGRSCMWPFGMVPSISLLPEVTGYLHRHCFNLLIDKLLGRILGYGVSISW
ncbi:hypothetical protein Tco_1517688 [Tanacetum coccineum]